MHRRVATVVAAAAVLLSLSGTADALPGPAAGASAARSSRPNPTDWTTIQGAARLRDLALRPGRTAYYRAFAAYMGLSGLVRLRPIQPGRCATAVSYLYDNLLDLHHAYPGEDWRPLRRAVAAQPSLRACAPLLLEPAYLPPA